MITEIAQLYFDYVLTLYQNIMLKKYNKYLLNDSYKFKLFEVEKWIG